MPRGTTLALGAAALVGGIYLLTRKKPSAAAPAPTALKTTTATKTTTIPAPTSLLPVVPLVPTVPTPKPPAPKPPAPPPPAPTPAIQFTQPPSINIPGLTTPFGASPFAPGTSPFSPTIPLPPSPAAPPPPPPAPPPAAPKPPAPTSPPPLKAAPRKTQAPKPPQTTQSTQAYESLRALNLQLVNQYRARVGAPPLTRRTSSEPCVDNQIHNDAAARTFHKNFQACSEHGQNEGNEGGSAPYENRLRDMLAGMWAEGPGGGHYDNIVSRRWTQLAVGFYVAPDGTLWFANDFY